MARGRLSLPSQKVMSHAVKKHLLVSASGISSLENLLESKFSFQNKPKFVTVAAGDIQEKGRILTSTRRSLMVL